MPNCGNYKQKMTLVTSKLELTARCLEKGVGLNVR
jgi:hypothetical protein